MPICVCMCVSFCLWLHLNFDEFQVSHQTRTCMCLQRFFTFFFYSNCKSRVDPNPLSSMQSTPHPLPFAPFYLAILQSSDTSCQVNQSSLFSLSITDADSFTSFCQKKLLIVCVNVSRLKLFSVSHQSSCFNVFLLLLLLSVKIYAPRVKKVN